MTPATRQLLPMGYFLATIIVLGTLGYMSIEGWNVLDALYMVVITIFTIGFQEIHPLSPSGKIFTMIIAAAGVGTVVYGCGKGFEAIVEGEVLGYRRKRKMQKKIKDMKNHIIICGYGRTGHQASAELAKARVPHVVIDQKPSTAEELEPIGVPYIIGDVINDDNLEMAGIAAARALICTADSDVANVYVTLSARALNQTLYIVARASDRDTEKKLKMAGASRVISPYFISGTRMAAWTLKPVTSDFLDMVMHGGSLEFSLQEITVAKNSPLIGKSLEEARIRQESGAMVLAIRTSTGTFNLQPDAGSRIEQGDTFVVIGTQEQLDLLKRVLNEH